MGVATILRTWLWAEVLNTDSLFLIVFSLIQETLHGDNFLTGAEQVGSRKHVFQHYLTSYTMFLKEEKEHIGKNKVTFNVSS